MLLIGIYSYLYLKMSPHRILAPHIMAFDAYYKNTWSLFAVIFVGGSCTKSGIFLAGNIINFNIGPLVDLDVPRSFWSQVSGKYGNMFYWKEKVAFYCLTYYLSQYIHIALQYLFMHHFCSPDSIMYIIGSKYEISHKILPYFIWSFKFVMETVYTLCVSF